MTVRVLDDELLICSDCAMITANGTLGQGDDSADQIHAETMMDFIGSPNMQVGRFVVLSSGHVVTFSSRPCDGCGETLAGERHPAAIIGTGPLRES